MAKKLYDVVVATRKYNDAAGQEKTVWENIGSVIQGEKGPFLSLKRTFNPAGVPNPENRDTVAISLFVPQETGKTGGNTSPANKPEQQNSVPDDDIPF